MAHLTLWQIEMWPWYALCLFWAITAVRVKPARSTEPLAARLFTSVVVGVAFVLLFSQQLRFGALGERFLVQNPWIERVGVVLTFLGAAISIWARSILGSNWSSRVSLKVDHELIRTGLYGHVRHPIYTGFLAAAIGTALVVGEWRSLLAVPIAIIGFALKAKREETLLTSAFGDTYRQYQRDTGFLLPRF